MPSRVGVSTMRNPYQRIAHDVPKAGRLRDWRITFASLEETAARHRVPPAGAIVCCCCSLHACVGLIILIATLLGGGAFCDNTVGVAPNGSIYASGTPSRRGGLHCLAHGPRTHVRASETCAPCDEYESMSVPACGGVRAG